MLSLPPRVPPHHPRERWEEKKTTRPVRASTLFHTCFMHPTNPSLSSLANSRRGASIHTPAQKILFTRDFFKYKKKSYKNKVQKEGADNVKKFRNWRNRNPAPRNYCRQKHPAGAKLVLFFFHSFLTRLYARRILLPAWNIIHHLC